MYLSFRSREKHKAEAYQLLREGRTSEARDKFNRALDVSPVMARRFADVGGLVSFFSVYFSYETRS